MESAHDLQDLRRERYAFLLGAIHQYAVTTALLFLSRSRMVKYAIVESKASMSQGSTL